jgi:glutamyl-tRNA reductase
MSLVVIGLNHKTASIDIREKMSISETEISAVTSAVCAHDKIKSCVVISTCNRTEFYVACDVQQTAIEQFCDWFKISYQDNKQHLYIKDNQACVEHIFQVASGLDSMVLGETQILGQVKTAYEISQKDKKLNNSLDRMFQTAFKVAKSVRSETDIGKNPVSVANSAVMLSKQIFGDLSQQNILMIGAGATVDLLLRYLSKHDFHHLSICNRSLGKAQILAAQYNCEAFDLQHLSSQLQDYDLIFTATASKDPIINADMIKQALKARKHRPMVIIDLAIPRDVDENVKKFNDVFYYAVDDLQKVISKNLQSREQAAITAKQIIQTESEIFLDWLKSQHHTQLIHNFQKETAKIRQDSLDKALKQLRKGESVEDVLYALANNLTKKLNHAPVKAIRSAIQSGDATKIHNIKQLLNLDLEK